MSADRITNDADIIDVRDVIERYEELQSEMDDDPTDEQRDELSALDSLLNDLKGNGGDEQWQGDWYPITLIRDDYFEDYAREFAEDIGAIPSDYSWPASHIDWEAAAEALQMDYTSVEFDGVTYWFR